MSEVISSFVFLMSSLNGTWALKFFSWNNWSCRSSWEQGKENLCETLKVILWADSEGHIPFNLESL